MTLIKKTYSGKVTIDLDGPNGSSFYLLALARDWAKHLDLDIDKVKTDLTAGNYKDLVTTFDEYFGEHIDLILPASGLH